MSIANSIWMLLAIAMIGFPVMSDFQSQPVPLAATSPVAVGDARTSMDDPDVGNMARRILVIRK